MKKTTIGVKVLVVPMMLMGLMASTGCFDEHREHRSDDRNMERHDDRQGEVRDEHLREGDKHDENREGR